MSTSSSGSCPGPDNSSPKDPLSDRIAQISSMLGPEISRVRIRRALAAAENNVNRAINFLIDSPNSKNDAIPVTSRGDEMAGPGAARANGGVSTHGISAAVGISEMRRSVSGSSSPKDPFSEKIDEISSMLGTEISRACIRRALAAADNDVNRAINFLIDCPNPEKDAILVARDEMDATGAACANDGVLTHDIGEMRCSDPDNTSLKDLLTDKIDEISSMLGSEISRVRIRQALAAADNDVNRAINFLMDNPNSEKNVILIDDRNVMEAPGVACAHDGVSTHGISLKAQKLDIRSEENAASVPYIRDKEDPQLVSPQEDDVFMSETEIRREETADNIDLLMPDTRAKRKSSQKDGVLMIPARVERDEARTSSGKDACINEHDFAMTSLVPRLNPRPIRALMPPPMVTDTRDQVCSGADAAEMDEFPEESDWFLLQRTYMTGLSTCRGKNKLQVSEVVHFSFPSEKNKVVGRRASYKAAATASEIVRFSTKRSGEIGKLPREWTRCLVPLVNSSRVKIMGRSVAQLAELSLMQDIILYVSIYIHRSIFTEGGNSSWTIPTPSYVDPTIHPLPTLFKLLKMKPTLKGDFIPMESDARKRPLSLQEDDEDEGAHIMGLAKRIKGDQAHPERCDDEQAISQSALNKLIGASDVYDLEEMEPPETLLCQLKPYQKQALYWMSELEKGIGAGQVVETLHPCWNAYNIVDRRAPTVYVNEFSGEATIRFPNATQMTRGGILADAMGLGKTVMTIALILSRPNEERLGYQHESMRHRDGADIESSTIQGGTLIVCPMALLGQWKDELETHCRSGTLSVFVHYGGDKASHPRVISQYDVVLTTYGVLSSAHGNESKNPSIFHKIHWHRIVLDEAHTIKASKTKVAQSAFALNSRCRWCLTGTPLQNNLEDLYSLLCFLHVEPWCNWTWWQKLIQGPYENGDEKGLRLVKAILRPLMLRRTKETKDKYGRPILVLPPATIQTVECIQSELEREIYDSLFWKSKIKFDLYVAQGKVLHNYANILELLLRLRQCCNHPFLLISRGDTQQHADLNKLAHQYLEGLSSHSGSAGPTKAYVEEVVEGIRRGEVSECPICLESASDDPVLTSCAHRMCRECLVSSWPTPSGGPCPICRNPLTQAGLITCPIDGRFQVDVEKNWKESSKVRKLIECLESLRSTGEKSIVFSQWTGFFDLVEIPLNRRSIGFLRFDGKLSQKQREKVLKEFNESKDNPVLLMSLKAGGVGLNLTAASNVFLMDPWWNPAVEEQAIMRIHRIGQKRQVRVKRFIVKDTVEERMQQVQARKQRMIAGALTDEEVRSARIEELKMLFRKS